MLEVGHPAPKLTVSLDTGESLDLASVAEPLVIFFYPKADTPGCTKESIAFSELKPEFDAIGVKLLGASKDTVEKQTKFKNKHGLTVDLAADVETDLCEQFGVWVEKNMYGKKYMGIQRATFVIKGGEVVAAWPKVKVAGHAEEVLEAVKSLG